MRKIIQEKSKKISSVLRRVGAACSMVTGKLRNKYLLIVVQDFFIGQKIESYFKLKHCDLEVRIAIYYKDAIGFILTHSEHLYGIITDFESCSGLIGENSLKDLQESIPIICLFSEKDVDRALILKKSGVIVKPYGEYFDPSKKRPVKSI